MTGSGDARDTGLSIRVEASGGETYVVVHGEIDLATASILGDALARAAELDGRSVVVDLADVAYLDSSGVHALFEALSAVRERGRSMRLVAVTPAVLRVLEITGVTAVVTVEPLEPRESPP